MSLNSNDQVFHPVAEVISNTELARNIGLALQEDFPKEFAAVKWIGRATNASLCTIRNWYEGRNTPSAGHLLVLAKASPAVLKFVLEQIGGKDLWETYLLFSTADPLPGKGPNGQIYSDKSVMINVPLNVPIKLNRRQKWFLMVLKSGKKIGAEDLAQQCQVSIKTARRDISDLKKAGRIRFAGSKKTGRYEIIDH